MANFNVRFHPAAEAEVVEAQAWYAARSVIAASAFTHELDLVVRRVIDAPECWPRNPNGTRRGIFPRFPFTLVYRISQDIIEVVAVAHLKRRPGYWKGR